MTCIWTGSHQFPSHITITTAAAFLFFLIPFAFASLNSDGLLLLSFKSSLLSDPLSLLQTWNSFDDSPCLWRGVTCSSFVGDGPNSRVIALDLPRSRLLGSIHPGLGLLPHLRHLDLSDNFLNGTLPDSLFNATELLNLSLSNNELSGQLPSLVANLRNLQSLDLSDNALAGQIPAALTALPNLTFLYLSNNYFSGGLPSGDGFQSLQFADLSSNLINGSLPPQFGGGNFRSLNLSYNRLSGGISPEFAKRTPANASLDLSFNNLTGEIPATGTFLNQKPDAFAGNPDLCGKPVKNPCSIPSTLSTPPNVSTSTSPLAIAAIPKTQGNPGGDGPAAAAANATVAAQEEGGLRPGTIAGIVVGDLAGIGIVSMVFLYVYQARKKQREETTTEAESSKVEKGGNEVSSPSSSPTTRFGLWCLKKKGGSRKEDEETTESETEEEEQKGGGESEKKEKEEESSKLQPQQQKRIGEGTLLTVDGEPELELETLLKASAYVLGATGSNIVYKAVVDDGTTFAVRRMGESGVGSLRDFESQVRLIAKLRHPNILRIRGFYWGEDDKLVIFDYAPNGSLATAYLNLKKQGSTPGHLSWDVRIRIARGVARGLTYLHEKKHVHGNLKPSNILLDADMEPKISDLGMEKLALGDNPSKGTSGLARQFGSKRSSSLPRDDHQDAPPIGASPSVSVRCASPYHAPESLKNLKPNPKWDVYSFGMVLLELLSGKLFSDKEVSGSISSEWSIISGEKNRVLKMVDVALRDDMEGKEEPLLACFKLGFSCASVTPQKRPSMKEALQILDKIPL